VSLSLMGVTNDIGGDEKGGTGEENEFKAEGDRVVAEQADSSV